MRFRLGCILAFFVVLCAHAQQGSPADDWSRFRAAYPYHIQTVALSGVHADGRRTMIVSEPPPGLTFEGIRSLSPDFADAEIGTHGIGVDGWVKDVVIDLPRLSDAALVADLDQLHRTLFGTTYKAYAASIPDAASRKPLPPLDLHVGAADLASWLLPPHPESATDPPTTNVIGFVVCALFLVWGLGRLLQKKPITGALLLLIGAFGLLGSSSSTLLLIVAAVLLVVTAMVFRRKHTVTGSVLACVVLMFFAVGVATHRSAVEAKLRFTPLLGGDEVTCDAILREGRSGIFLSQPSGVVLWSLPRSQAIDGLSTQIREFALDTDMVVGAVARGDQLVIVGRERTTDVSRLPPLRAETVLLLASAKEDELKQSYERTVMLAGKAHDPLNGEEDWAPILLSPRLIDTEYGSLLNVTDQLLKSWSESGGVRYVNFRYPAPAVSYPFEGGVMKHLGADEVTYNWNTKGAGYVDTTGPYQIFALNRTAALPIDYLAMGRPNVQQAEDAAYDWYAGLSDPNLIRVVHYAALYQIFHHFGVHAAMAEPKATQPFDVLEEPTESFLHEIADYDDHKMALLASVAGPGVMEDIVQPAHEALKAAEAGNGPFSLQQIAIACTDRAKAVSILQSASAADVRMLEELLSKLREFSNAPWFEDDKTEAMQLYRMSDTQHPGTWIRTPSIVESTTKGGIGGHNLGSKVTLLESDGSVAAGTVSVRDAADGQRVIHFNPADEARVGGAVRNAARDDSMSASDVQEAVVHEMAAGRKTVIDPAEGLGHGLGVSPDPLRGLQVSRMGDGATSFGWQRGNVTLGDADAKLLKQLKGGSNQVMLLTRTEDGRYLIGMEGGQSIEAHDQATAIDGFLQMAATSPDKRIHLHTRGLDERQTRGFLSGTGRYVNDYDVVVTRDEDLDLEMVKAIMADKYDLKKAQFGEIRISEPDATGLMSATQEVEIPAKARGLKSLILEIQVFFKKLPADLVAFKEQIASQIRLYFENVSEERDLRFAAAGLTRSLEKKGIYANVRTRVKDENKVAFYADLMVPPQDDDASGRPSRLCGAGGHPSGSIVLPFEVRAT